MKHVLHKLDPLPIATLVRVWLTRLCYAGYHLWQNLPHAQHKWLLPGLSTYAVHV